MLLCKLHTMSGVIANPLFTGEHNADVNQCCYSPDGSAVLSCSYDRTVKMWDLKSNLLWTGQHNDNVYHCCFAPDESTVLSCSWDKTVKMWDLTGNLLWTGQHDNWVLHCNTQLFYNSLLF